MKATFGVLVDCQRCGLLVRFLELKSRGQAAGQEKGARSLPPERHCLRRTLGTERREKPPPRPASLCRMPGGRKYLREDFCLDPASLIT